MTSRLLAAIMLSVVLMIADFNLVQIKTVRSYLATIFYPIQQLAHTPLLMGNWLDDTFSGRKSLLEDNQRLSKDNLHLRAQQQKMLALEAENMRLRELLKSSFKVGERVLIAELLSIELDPFKQQVLINKGTQSGLYNGQAVLDASGVMGQVIHTNPLTSRVMMITDARHAIPVEINRNGIRTIAMGTGRTDALELQNLAKNADIREGDLLVTSGLGGVFPAGYPVASITEVKRTTGDSFAQISAKPIANLDRIREVLVVWSVKDDTPALEEETEAIIQDLLEETTTEEPVTNE